MRIYTIGLRPPLENNGDNTFHYSVHAAKAKHIVVKSTVLFIVGGCDFL